MASPARGRSELNGPKGLTTGHSSDPRMDEASPRSRAAHLHTDPYTLAQLGGLGACSRNGLPALFSDGRVVVEVDGSSISVEDGKPSPPVRETWRPIVTFRLPGTRSIVWGQRATPATLLVGRAGSKILPAFTSGSIGGPFPGAGSAEQLPTDLSCGRGFTPAKGNRTGVLA